MTDSWSVWEEHLACVISTEEIPFEGHVAETLPYYNKNGVQNGDSFRQSERSRQGLPVGN